MSMQSAQRYRKERDWQVPALLIFGIHSSRHKEVLHEKRKMSVLVLAVNDRTGLPYELAIVAFSPANNPSRRPS